MRSYFRAFAYMPTNYHPRGAIGAILLSTDSLSPCLGIDSWQIVSSAPLSPRSLFSRTSPRHTPTPPARRNRLPHLLARPSAHLSRIAPPCQSAEASAGDSRPRCRAIRSVVGARLHGSAEMDRQPISSPKIPFRRRRQHLSRRGRRPALPDPLRGVNRWTSTPAASGEFLASQSVPSSGWRRERRQRQTRSPPSVHHALGVNLVESGPSRLASVPRSTGRGRWRL